MATQVQIELTVDEKGAVQGIRNFDTAVKGSTGSVQQLNAQLNQAATKATAGTDAFNVRLKAAMSAYEEQSKRGAKVQEFLGQQFDKFSKTNPAVVAFEKAAEAARGFVPAAQAAKTATEGLSHSMEGHFQTSFDRVRLLRSELGVRVPRAMETVIARNATMMAGINRLGGLLVGFGAATIAFDFGKEIYNGLEHIWRDYLSVTQAAKDYNAEVAKSRQQDFGNTRSIEDTEARIAQATREMNQLNAAAQFAEHTWRPGWLNQRFNAHDYAVAASDRKKEIDQLNLRKGEQEHELRVQRLGIEYSSAGLTGSAARSMGLRRKLAEDAENASWVREQDRILHNPVSDKSGAQRQALADALAQKEAAGEAAREERAQHEETLRLQAEAREANLRGEALYMDQRNEMLRQLRDKMRHTELSPIEYRRQVAAVEEKYDYDRMRRLENYEHEVEQAQAQAALGLFRGIGHMQAQADIEIGDIRASQRPDSVKDSLVKSVRDRLSVDIANQVREDRDRTDEMAEQQSSRSLRGFARINAVARNSIADRRRTFENEYGQIDRSTPEGEQAYQSGLKNFNREKRLITAGAGVDARELTQHNSEETQQIEDQARARYLQAERNQTGAIEAEYDQRLTKLRNQLEQQEISYDDYNRRVLAAEEERDAQMVEAARQAREKMAGEFSRFFRSPMESLKEFGDRAAGEAAATMIQRIGGHFGATPMTASAGGPFGGLWARMGHLPGVPEFGQRPHEIAPQHGMITLSSAQIQIGTASLTVAGSSGATPGALDAGWSPMPFAGDASAGSTAGSSSLVPTSTSAGRLWASPAVASTMMRSTPMPWSPTGGGSILANARQAFSVGKTGLQLFRGLHQRGAQNSLDVIHDPLSGTLNADGTFSSGASKSGAMLTGGGFGANAMGAAGGVLGLYGAYQSSGGVGGAAQGAMSGMELGMAVGGPVGAAIGAAAGAVFGAIGFGGKEKARVYDLKQVRPRLGNDMDAYQQGSADYTSTYMDMESLIKEADMATHAMGPAGGRYYNDTIKPEIKQAEGKLNAEQRAGRSKYTATASQFDQGGWAGDFGDMATGPASGWAHMRRGEFVVHEQPAATHAGALEAIRAGASRADMARYYGAEPEDVARGYRAAMLSTAARTSGAGDRTLNMNVHAIDARSVAQFFDKYKHHIRAAVNASYAENSGGSDA